MATLIAFGMLGLTLVWTVYSYNKFIRFRHRVRQAWSDVDVQLKRRHDLVPALAATLRGYTGHERELLTRLTELRHSDDPEPTVERADKETRLSGDICQALLVAEDYPELKANELFASFQKDLVNVEDHLQFARRYLNGAVRDWNQHTESFPGIIIARLLSFHPKNYFEIELARERAAPEVSL
jgi:LemA protein